ncbi:hypothetical protein DPMN_122632 [Dreissena polymorpha]|uniref:Uncharacterized protein n=1 Tax=Dreissena polymorpha TaxID=45954 RepID=A0A9D4GQ16_DREPO|nr:hypothetical protein DPMN_122632 [Dreissena polymorpha]
MHCWSPAANHLKGAMLDGRTFIAGNQEVGTVRARQWEPGHWARSEHEQLRRENLEV